jgi:hypothetical protein
MPDVTMRVPQNPGDIRIGIDSKSPWDVIMLTAATGTADVRMIQRRFPDIVTAGAVTYYGILKRWTGATWVKAKLMVYTGSWKAKKLYCWDGADWKEVDATGY